MKRGYRHGAAAAGVLALVLAAGAAMADVNSALRAYQSTTTAATQVMAGMTDAATAKAGAQQLQGAMAQQRTAEKALHAELLKLNLNDKNNATLMETTTAEMAKTNEQFSAQQVRILSDPAIGAVVGKVFATQTAPASKAH
jgi:hypothetical protein